VSGIINRLFDRLELYHGLIFVRHALSYLTASKNGLSDMEMEDLLSLDDRVSSIFLFLFLNDISMISDIHELTNLYVVV